MKQIGITIGYSVIILLVIGFVVGKYNSTKADENIKTYTMQEILSDENFTADFNVKEKSLVIETVNLEEESKRIDISKEDEQRLIEKIEQWKLIKNIPEVKDTNANSFADYSLYLTLNTGYKLYAVSRENRLYVMDRHIEGRYIIQNGDEFFTLLENVMQKPPTK